MNANNFQQFVSSNQGKLITFKHQGADISKYVVDVCGEYFTCKGRETDAKIDGFYYFSDCEMYKPTLIEALTRHRYVVLIGKKSPMCDAFFEYKYCKEANSTLMVIGKQLSATNPDVGYAAPYIGEVWAIVEGKYTKVWEKTNDTLFINGDDLKNIGVIKFDSISEGTKKQSREEEIKEEKVSEKDTGASGPVKIEYRGKEKIVEIMNECTHKNGKKYIWVRDLSDNGKTKTLFKEYVKYIDGKIDKVNENGRREEYTLKEGKREGEYKRWYKSGQLEIQCHNKEGKREGEYKVWHENGKLDSQCYYKNGKLEGEYKCWNENGQTWIQSYYKEGEIDGEYKSWYFTGKLAIHCYYKEGKLEGEYKGWDFQGILNKHYLYKNNEIVQNLLS